VKSNGHQAKRPEKNDQGGTVENPGKIRSIRKTIARILTIEREEQLKAQSTKK
jgi:ribosomal protein L29